MLNSVKLSILKTPCIKFALLVLFFSVYLVYFHESLSDSGLEPWCCLPCGFGLLPSHDSHRFIHPDLFEVIDPWSNCPFILFLSRIFRSSLYTSWSFWSNLTIISLFNSHFSLHLYFIALYILILHLYIFTVYTSWFQLHQNRSIQFSHLLHLQTILPFTSRSVCRICNPFSIIFH